MALTMDVKKMTGTNTLHKAYEDILYRKINRISSSCFNCHGVNRNRKLQRYKKLYLRCGF